MAVGGSRAPQPAKFGVYQSKAAAPALASHNGARCMWVFAFLVATWMLLYWTWRKESVITVMRLLRLNLGFAKAAIKVVQMTLTVLFLGALSALCKLVLSTDSSVFASPRAKEARPSQTKPSPGRSSSPKVMVPLHSSALKGSKAGSSSPFLRDRKSTLDVTPTKPTTATTTTTTTTTTPLQVSSFPHLSPSSPLENTFNPWAMSAKKDDIRNVKELEEFVADVGSKLEESAGKTPSTTPQVSTSSPYRVGVASPSFCATQAANANTPVRTLRLSPSVQKSTSSPKKTDGDLPAPFTMEQAVEGYRKLGIYPDIENWRDGLRQWFSDVLLGPLVCKIERSHLQVMEAAAKLNYHIRISPIGGVKTDQASGAAGMEGTPEWHTTHAPDEDALVHQFRAALISMRSNSNAPSIFGLKTQQPPEIPYLQECLDAVTEHQRLRALVKGEWVKGLLPQSSVRADYTIQRLRELAEGSCVKKYEFAGTGEVYDKTTKRWSLELPTDAHLLVYLFCALLEHPQWMLHVDPTSYPSTQSGNDPLFIASLPQKERFPEKYVAVLSSAPPVLHAGACILAVGKQSPPVFALYWEKKLQFSLQGRSALWDAILLLCYRIKVAHGGVVRGVDLGGSAFNLLQLLEQRSSSEG